MDTILNYNQLASFTNNISAAQAGRNSSNSRWFEIHTLEWMVTQKSFWNRAAEKPGHFEIIWIRKGTGVLEVDGEGHKLQGNTIFCISPGHIRKYNLESMPEGYYVSFTLEFIQRSEGYSGGSAWLEQYTNSSKITTIV